MATQDDMYRESQKTTAELQRVVGLLEAAKKRESGLPKNRAAVVKKLEQSKKEAEKANETAVRREEIERKLLGQTEKQYDEMLEQRKVTEKSKKAMEEIEAVLGEDAKNNRQYQAAERLYKKQQLKSQKLENRRSLFQRFKDTKEDKGTRAAVGELAAGGKDLAGKALGKLFEPLKKLFSKFAAVFSVFLIGLVAIVNSPMFEKIKQLLFDFVDFFAENVYPVLVDLKNFFLNTIVPALIKIKDDVMPIFKQLYDDVLKPIYDAFINFMGKEGGGLDIILEGLEKQFENFKNIFQNVVDLLKGIVTGDFELIKESVSNLGKNILKAIKDAIDTALKFVLSLFGMEGEGKTGTEMLGNVVDNFFKKIVDGVMNIFDYVMRGVQSAVRAVAGDTIGDKIFGKRDVRDMTAEERLEESKDLKDDLEDKEKDVTKAAEETEKAETRLKDIQTEKAKLEAKGDTLNNQQKRRLTQLKKSEASAEEKLTAKRLDEKEARDELAADKQRIQKLEEANLPTKGQSKELNEKQMEKAANDNKSGTALVDASTKTVNEAPKTENNTTTPPSMRPSGSTGQLAMGAGSMAGAFD